MVSLPSVRSSVLRSGQAIPPMYTESLPGDQSLALLFTALTESMAGLYSCTASYANSEFLLANVTIETYGKNAD